MYWITRGAREASFRSLKSVSETLADEIIGCSKVNISLTYVFNRDNKRTSPSTVPLLRRRMNGKESPRETDDS